MSGATRLARPDPARASYADAYMCAGIGLVVRLGVALWAARRFPPAEDGHYFDIIARRIADGEGYTWLWPDGAVTHAAHYPVGYPALLGLAYTLFGPFPGVAMAVNAALGAVLVLAVHRIANASASRPGALFAGMAAALHPGLVFYTPALMTEGAAAALLAVAAWGVVRASRIGVTPKDAFKACLLTGTMLGLATLMRPQLLLLAPLFGCLALQRGGFRPRAVLAVTVTAVAIAVCLPWTVRNCVQMKSCSLVSVNAGWNLYIGAAPGATGSWTSIDVLGVPPECRTVWDEAAKDHCFGRAGVREILQRPLDFVKLVPKKLGSTFDYAGAAGWYLHSSNPAAFGDHEKQVLGGVETVWERLLVLAGLAAAARLPGPNSAARKVVAALSAVFLFMRPAYLAHLGLVAVAALLGRRLPRELPVALAAAVVLATAVTHAVFFGAGRYSLPCFPLLAALAGTLLTERGARVDTEG